MLSLANIGFMLRDTRSLNKAASPVKFPEYLAAGLAVASSPGTGDASDIIVENRIGVLIDAGKLGEGFEDLFEIVKADVDVRLISERARGVAEKYYNWNSFQNVFQTLYAS